MSLKQSAEEVLAILERGCYEVDGSTVSIEAAHQVAMNGSRLYAPNELDTSSSGRFRTRWFECFLPAPLLASRIKRT